MVIIDIFLMVFLLDNRCSLLGPEKFLIHTIFCSQSLQVTLKFQWSLIFEEELHRLKSYTEI